MTTKQDNEKSDDVNLSMEDLVRIQDDIRKVVDVNKPDSELTAEQIAKKIIFQTTGKILEENMGKDFMEKLQDYREQVDKSEILGANWKKLIELGREIEKIFTVQRAGLTYHFDHSDENHYRKAVDGMTTNTIQDKSLSNEERLEAANKILNLIKAYREKMFVDLQTQQDRIHDLLSGFEKRVKETPFDFFKESDDISKIKPQLESWIDLSWKLYNSRKKVVDVVSDHLDADEIIPNHIVKNNGDASGNVSAKDMFSKMDRVVAMTNEADNAEKEIEGKRVKISEELFGKADEYMNFGEENASSKEEVTTQNESGGMSKKTKWIIVIVLSIVALSWGIWTAIGVFILGMIMINVLSNK